MLIKEEEFYDNLIFDKYLEDKEKNNKKEDQKKEESYNKIDENENKNKINIINEDNNKTLNVVNNFIKKSRNKKSEIKQQNSSEIIENLFKKNKSSMTERRHYNQYICNDTNNVKTEIQNQYIYETLGFNFKNKDISSKMNLPKSVYHTYQYKNKNVLSICVICLGEFLIGEEVLTLPCFHFFHSKCINEWYKYGKKCPICNTVVDKEDKSSNNQFTEDKKSK